MSDKVIEKNGLMKEKTPEELVKKANVDYFDSLTTLKMSDKWIKPEVKK